MPHHAINPAGHELAIGERFGGRGQVRAERHDAGEERGEAEGTMSAIPSRSAFPEWSSMPHRLAAQGTATMIAAAKRDLPPDPRVTNGGASSH